MQAVVWTSGAGSVSSNHQRKKTSIIQIVFQKSSTKIQIVFQKSSTKIQVVFQNLLTKIQIVFQKTSTKMQVVSEDLNKAAKIFQVVFLFSPTILQRQLDRSGRRSSLVEQNCDRLLRPQIRNWRQIGSKSKFRLETANFKSVLRHLRKMIWCQGLVWWK